MDANKAVVLDNIDYTIRPCNSLRDHSEFAAGAVEWDATTCTNSASTRSSSVKTWPT